MKGKYEFNGTFKGRQVKAVYELESWPDSEYEQGGEEMNPISIEIDGVNMYDNIEFWDNFGWNDDGLYEHLCIHAGNVDAENDTKNAEWENLAESEIDYDLQAALLAMREL